MKECKLVVSAVVAFSCIGAPVFADTVTLTPDAGVTTNVLSLFTGDTAVEVAGPGTVKLNNANAHTGGTTLSGGTLAISGNIPAGSHSPVGAGTFTVSGGTLLGSGTFGGDITGTGAFTNLATDGWVWTGNNTFAEPVTLADGSLAISGGTTSFGKHFYVGVGGSDVSFTMSGGSVAMNANNVQLSYGKFAKSSFTMTGGSFDLNGKNVVTGYSTTYATNTFEVSGDAVFGNINQIYPYTGSGNRMDINVHDGGTLGFKLLKRGSDNKGTAKAYLRVNGGVLRNDKTDSSDTATFVWIGGNSSNTGQRLTSFTIGPKGATFATDNGDVAGVAQIYSAITAEQAGAGETPAGVTFSGGRFACYLAMDYEGPTAIRNGATLYVGSGSEIPSSSAVTIERGSMLRLMGTDKTVSSLTLEDGAALGFGTPSSGGANTAVLTVSSAISLPQSAKIGLYTLNTAVGVSKNDNGTYAVLNVPAAYAAALRTVRWSCATITEGKSATFAVSESGGTATLSMTIADSDAATTSGDISVGPGEYVSLDGSLNVKSRTVTVDGGYLKIGASLTETSGNGAVYVENGGLLDVYNYVRFSNDANSRYDLYVRNGGIVRALLFSPPSGVTVADLTNVLHLDGGTLQFVAPRMSDYSDNNRQNPYKISVLVGVGGATFDLSHWADRERTGWFRFSADNLEFNHDPNCAGADGGITICGSNGDTILYYFKSLGNSTMNGGITVADGGVISTVSGLTNQTVRIQPGGMYRGYNASNAAGIQNLVLGEANATKPVEIVVCQNSTIPTLVVTGSLSVRSPVTINVAQRWDYDASLVSGVYTALVYQASCSVNPTLFQLPAGSAGTLSAREVTLSGGDYDGCKALVVTIDNDIVVTSATEYPTPLTVSSERSCGSIVVGGAWNGVADPVRETALTISGNVTAADALYLGCDPAPGANADTGWHKGFLMLNGGSITTPAVYSIYRPGYGSGNSDCRFGCEATINGGLLDVAGDVCLGHSRSKYGDNLYSRLTVNGGRVAVGGRFYLLYCNTSGAYSAPGSIVLNDGEVDVTGLIDLSRNSQRRDDCTAYTEKFGIWLNGGVLKAENIMMTATTATSPQLVFNGGIYAPYGADAANRTMENLNVCYVSTNGAVISTENIPAGETYTIAQPLLTDPALNGTVDGGLRKIGAGTLALTGANTYTGLTKVEEGALDLSGGVTTLAQVAASGVIVGNLTITDALVVGNAGSLLSVEGDVTLSARTAIDFDGSVPDTAWRPVLAASGTLSVPTMIRARSGGDFNRCMIKVEDGVLYVRPTTVGMVIRIQ